LNPGAKTDNQELGGNFSCGHEDYFPPIGEPFAARNVNPIARQHRAEVQRASLLGFDDGEPINVPIYLKFTVAMLSSADLPKMT
jgi:hypothetical protein